MQASGIETSTAVEKVADAAPDGAAALVPAVEAAPGEELVYTVRFANRTDAAADGVRVTSAIPSGMEYVAGSASGPGAAVLYSVDGGRRFGAPEELLVEHGDGMRRRAEPAAYTHVRWVLDRPLAGGASGFARFRAVRRGAP